jgi:predicted nucleic-acid-binding protein
MKDYSYFVDTNIFLRPIVKDDPLKVAACENIIDLISKGAIEAFTSHLVLAELVWTSQKSYHIEKGEISKVLQGIASIKNLKIKEEFNVMAAIRHYTRRGVKFIDALIASDSSIQSGGVQIISYDRDFDKLKIPRIEPRELIQRYKVV